MSQEKKAMNRVDKLNDLNKDLNKEEQVDSVVLMAYDGESSVFNVNGSANKIGTNLANTLIAILSTDENIKNAFIESLSGIDGQLALAFQQSTTVNNVDVKNFDGEQANAYVNSVMQNAYNSIQTALNPASLSIGANFVDVNELSRDPRAVQPVIELSSGNPTALAYQTIAVLEKFRENDKFEAEYQKIAHNVQGQ